MLSIWCYFVSFSTFHFICKLLLVGRFMREQLLSEVLEALIVIRGLIVQKTKLISDCDRLLKDLLDGLLMESSRNKRKFIRACISGLHTHADEKRGRASLVCCRDFFVNSYLLNAFNSRSH